MQYIINQTAIVLFFEGKPLKIEKTSPEYPRIIAAFDLPDSEQDAKIKTIITRKIDKFNYGGFSVSPEGVTFNGERLPTALANKVRSIVAEDLPIKLFTKFWENLQANPSANSVRELYEFLEYKELPITEDGCFLAYKGVQKNGYSCSGNTNTKVLQGIVDSNGKIKNNVGDTIEVLRRDVDDERRNHCSYGLHVGSLDYASSFGAKTLVVKVNPADVVSVPEDYSCQKCRVAKYEVIDSFSNEIEASITDEDGNPIKSEASVESSKFIDRVEAYTLKKFRDTDYVSVQSIQNSFSPEYPSRTRVLDALNDVGIHWEEIDGKFYAVDND